MSAEVIAVDTTTRRDQCYSVAALHDGKPWVFVFYGDCGLDVAHTPGGQVIHTYTHDGSVPNGVPAELWELVTQEDLQ